MRVCEYKFFVKAAYTSCNKGKFVLSKANRSPAVFHILEEGNFYALVCRTQDAMIENFVRIVTLIA